MTLTHIPIWFQTDEHTVDPGTTLGLGAPALYKMARTNAVGPPHPRIENLQWVESVYLLKNTHIS